MRSDWAVSIRKACGAIGFDRSTFHYKSRRTGQAAVAKWIREICETRVRYGYRRVHCQRRSKTGVRPCGWTRSRSGFDGGSGVAILELGGAEIPQG